MEMRVMVFKMIFRKQYDLSNEQRVIYVHSALFKSRIDFKTDIPEYPDW